MYAIYSAPSLLSGHAYQGRIMMIGNYGILEKLYDYIVLFSYQLDKANILRSILVDY